MFFLSSKKLRNERSVLRLVHDDEVLHVAIESDKKEQVTTLCEPQQIFC